MFILSTIKHNLIFFHPLSFILCVFFYFFFNKCQKDIMEDMETIVNLYIQFQETLDLFHNVSYNTHI